LYGIGKTGLFGEAKWQSDRGIYEKLFGRVVRGKYLEVIVWNMRRDVTGNDRGCILGIVLVPVDY